MLMARKKLFVKYNNFENPFKKIYTKNRTFHILQWLVDFSLPVHFCKILWQTQRLPAGTSPDHFCKRFSMQPLSNGDRCKSRPSHTLLVPTEPERKCWNKTKTLKSTIFALFELRSVTKYISNCVKHKNQAFDICNVILIKRVLGQRSMGS